MTTKETILTKLREELKRAEEKEKLALEEWRESGGSDRYHKYLFSATSYKNGILEAIDIVTRVKEEV